MEVVQLYLNDVCGSVTTPVRALKGFEKVFLAAGESRSVQFTLTPSEMALIDTRYEEKVEKGTFEVSVGPLCKTFEVTTDFWPGRDA